ncbi:hypothetical protein ACIRBX_29630 [Kitasatospora sp. NPDC096147]|uniref:hypothetical protein n=1 Tax=Kitasatospora sp. NPDC096147 TaxID=3364093 RepID=UPI003821A32F
MLDSLINLALGLLASAISAGLGWLAHTARGRRRLGRIRAFFGMPAGSDCLLVVNRHTAAASSKSVSRHDVYALMELAALIKECGAQAEVTGHDQVRQGLGDKAEFCLGGPESNERTAAHLRNWLPGVTFTPPPGGTTYGSTITVGEQEFAFTDTGDRPSAYVLLARIRTAPGSRPVFLIAGQTATSNHAAVRHLTARHRELARTHGAHGTFAVVLRVVNPSAYGPDVVEVAADVTGPALTTALAAAG